MDVSTNHSSLFNNQSSNVTMASCSDAYLTRNTRTGLITCYAIIFLIGFTGNAGVIYIIGIKNRLVKTFDIQIVSLAIADLLTAIFVPLVAVQDMVLNLTKWVLLGTFGCKTFISIDHVTTLASSLTLILISAERLRSIKRLNQINDNTRKFARFEIVAVWIISLSVVSPYAESLSFQHNICYNWTWTLKQLFLYYAIYINLCCFVPAFILSNVYIKSIYLLSQNDHKLINEKRKKQFKRITVMFSCIILLFFTLTIPYMVIHFVSSYYGTFDVKAYCENHSLHYSLVYGFYTLSRFSCCINPFVYVTMHPKVKKSAAKLLNVKYRAASTWRVTTTAVTRTLGRVRFTRRRRLGREGKDHRDMVSALVLTTPTTTKAGHMTTSETCVI